MFQIPTSTPTDLLANVQDQLADPGTLALVVLIVSVPFAFYVIKKVIGLVRGGAK